MNEKLNSKEDYGLLVELSEGSKKAFDTLYNKYWTHVFNAAYKRLDNPEQAQDITQEVFIQLWLRGSKTIIDDLPAYLYVSAKNAVFKHFEKQSKFPVVPDLYAAAMESTSGGPDANILHKEFISAFNRLVETLPEQQRTIFKMRFEDELSSLQIAGILNISPKTVRNQIGKALATLRSSLLYLYILITIYPQK